MPVKRRTSKQQRHRITPECVSLFRIALETQPIYRGCDDGKNCQSDDPGRYHCEDCRRYLGVCSELHSLLGLAHWEADVMHAEGDPPDWMADNELQSESWRQAASLRSQLMAVVDGTKTVA